MDHRDSGFSGQTDVLEEYEERRDNLLDHLVPAQHRSGQPSKVPTRELISDEPSLRSMQTACREAEETYSRKQWSLEVLDGFNRAFATVIKEQTPSSRDAEKRRDILERLGSIVGAGLDGQTGLRVEPYGSFVSGLYCPTGDLDISIEGLVSNRDGRGGRQAREMGKMAKAALLRALSKRLERSRLTSGYIQRILHARVPILKFVWAGSGIPCDVSVGSANARFKAEVVKALHQMDERFGQMLRLVKVWSGAHGLNDASSGTFNSFALSLMVLFHLQLRQPPVLPPLHELFGDTAEAVSSRPLHFGQEIQDGVLEAFLQKADMAPRSENRETLAELLASFFAHFAAAAVRWRVSDGACDVRASTWCGAWTYGFWPKSYMAAVEDPFDYMDNCTRTIGRERLPHIASCLQEAANVMLSVRDAKGVDRALAWLFGSVAPANLPLGLRTTEDSIGMLKDRNSFQCWRETRQGPQPNGAYGTPPKDGTPQDNVSPYDPLLQTIEAAVKEGISEYISDSQKAAVPDRKVQASALEKPQLLGIYTAHAAPSTRPQQRNARVAHSPQPPITVGVTQIQPAASVPRPPPPSHHPHTPPTPYYAASPLAAAQPPPPFKSGAETGGAASTQQPSTPLSGFIRGGQPSTPLSGFIRGGQLSSPQTQQQPGGKTPSDVLRRMLNINGGSAAAASSAQQPPPAAAATAFAAASGSATSHTHDHAGTSALRNMLKIPESGGNAHKTHSSSRNAGGSKGNASAQRRGAGSLRLAESLDLGKLDLNADAAATSEADSRRGAEAGPQEQLQPRPPPKAYKARKAVPIKAGPADPAAPASDNLQKPRQDGRKQAAAPVESAAACTGTPGSTANSEASAGKPNKNHRRRHPPRAQAQPQDNRSVGGNGAHASGGPPVAAPVNSAAQVVEVRRKFKIKRNNTAIAPA